MPKAIRTAPEHTESNSTRNLLNYRDSPARRPDTHRRLGSGQKSPESKRLSTPYRRAEIGFCATGLATPACRHRNRDINVATIVATHQSNDSRQLYAGNPTRYARASAQLTIAGYRIRYYSSRSAKLTGAINNQNFSEL